MLTRRAFSEISNVTVCQAPSKPAIKKTVGSRKSCQAENTFKKSVQVRQPRVLQSDFTNHDDIDAYYKGSPVFLSEYAPEVFRHLMAIESQTPIQPWPLNALVTPNMRGKVVDWIASVVDFHRLLQETFHLTVSLFDRYIQSNAVEKATLQLVAISCLSLAVKYEELQDISVCDLLGLTRNAYTRKEFVAMEISVLKTVRFSLGRPLPITFLRRFNMVAKADRVQHGYGKFLLDLCMLEATLVHVAPSLLAAATTFIALSIVKKEISSDLWTPMFVRYTTYEFERLKPLLPIMSTVLRNRGTEFKAISHKYAKSEQLRVSEIMSRHEHILSMMKNLK